MSDVRPTILVVEDHRDTAQLACHFMTGSGFACAYVHNAREAARWLQTSMPALILLDDSLPELSGLEFLKILKGDSRYKNIPVVFYSAGPDQQRQKEAIAAGAEAWFTKGNLTWQLLTKTVGALATHS